MLNIDRHNYEEYFILYMDNELSAEERAAVESFVQKHPDLKEELDQILQYKLVPDTELSYPFKEELLKGQEYGSINTVNYESWLLLYVDNELSVDERKMVGQFVNDHPAAAASLALLQKTKLPAAKISCPDKNSLYRRERRIAPFWMAAAAVLILALG